MDLSNYETTCIAGTFKKYLRELPDPVIPEKLYPHFVEAASKYKIKQLDVDFAFLFGLL